MAFYRICPDCGAYLDPGEQCSCHEERLIEMERKEKAIFHKTLQYHEDTTEKRDISQEDIEFLKRLQLEMNTQDTTGTADPRFWVIKGSERVVDNENPDELVLQGNISIW